MKIHLCCQDELHRACQDIIRVFYPTVNFIPVPEGADFSIQLDVSTIGNQVAAVAVKLPDRRTVSAQDVMFQSEAAHNARKRVAKLAVKALMESCTGSSIGPWGILTGIRPTKIAHRFLDLGWTAAQTAATLSSSFALSPAKCRLLLETVELQRDFLHPPATAGRYVSIYIGIPFCPTRCVYCSFPAYSIQRHRGWVEPFVKALLAEIQGIGQVVKELGLNVETIYIGGGTPTSLPAAQLSQVMQAVEKWLRSPETVEYTVEAGRPDTLSMEVLTLLRSYDISRLSINPQSMNPTTLKAIGRDHSPEDIIRAVHTARNLGFANINMDLIIGLPGEGVEEINHTLEQLRELKPENLTVHTLALKRASQLTANLKAGAESALTVAEPALIGAAPALPKANPDLTGANHPMTGDAEAGRMLELTYQYARAAGQRPYYLYRQKHMLGSLENVGFALPGYEGRYNIQMMEERQTIIGLGGGAASKWVNSADWSLEAAYNPKDPQYYFQRISELIAKKTERLKGLATMDY